MHGAREYGIGEDVGKEFYHGPWTRTTHPSHHHSKVWHASSVGHAGLLFMDSGLTFCDAAKG